MSEQTPEPNPDAEVSEYTDDNGNTFQLNAEDAERMGFKKSAESKVVTADDDDGPRPAGRRATTK